MAGWCASCVCVLSKQVSEYIELRSSPHSPQSFALGHELSLICKARPSSGSAGTLTYAWHFIPAAAAARPTVAMAAGGGGGGGGGSGQLRPHPPSGAAPGRGGQRQGGGGPAAATAAAGAAHRHHHQGQGEDNICIIAAVQQCTAALSAAYVCRAHRQPRSFHRRLRRVQHRHRWIDQLQPLGYVGEIGRLCGAGGHRTDLRTQLIDPAYA
eukprot:COSAG06_NODE_1619_length_8908_cov_3.222727_8_plen_211_part_00